MDKNESIIKIKELLKNCIPTSFKDSDVVLKDAPYVSPLPHIVDIYNYLMHADSFDEYIKRLHHCLDKFKEALNQDTKKMYHVDVTYTNKRVDTISRNISTILNALKCDIDFKRFSLEPYEVVYIFSYKDNYEIANRILKGCNLVINKLENFVQRNNLYQIDFTDFKFSRDFLDKTNSENYKTLIPIAKKCYLIADKTYNIGILEYGEKEYEEMAKCIFNALTALYYIIKPTYTLSYTRKKCRSYDPKEEIPSLLESHFKPLRDLLNDERFLINADVLKLNKVVNNFPKITNKLGKIDEEDVGIGQLKLQFLVGLDKVKKSIDKIKAFAKVNAKSKFGFHMAFFGNPGTGKTLVARIIAEILYENGVLPTNKLVEVDRQGLVGQYVGETAIKTQAAIDRAMGGVLFIDEAYALDVDGFSGDYGHEAIATLIKAMEDKCGKFCVILAGYTNELTKMINSNPGFKSRIQFRLNFDNYSRSELYEIGLDMLDDMNYICDNETIQRMLDITDMLRNSPDFANARTMRNILEGSIMCQNLRAMDSKNHTILLEDVETYMKDNDIVIKKKPNEKGKEDAQSGIDMLENLIGLESIKKSVKKIKAYVSKNFDASNFNMHMCFTGNPGTGKTEVARIMSRILYEAGALKEAKVIETDASGLISKYVGDTQIKTKELVDKAMGGVLFIDEAYSLMSDKHSNNGEEAIATLLKEMEDNRGKFCVILAGYKNEMESLLSSNPGFDSRIQFKVNFPDYDYEELKEISKYMLSKLDYQITDDAIDVLMQLVIYLKTKNNFANARTIRNVLDQVILNQNLRTEEEIDNKTIIASDVKEYIEEKGFDIKIASRDVAYDNADLINFIELAKDNFASLNVDEDYLRQSIISISNENGGQSSGFIISEDGYALTCAHCLKLDGSNQNARIIIHLPGQGFIPIYNDIKVIKVDKENDLALIKLNNDNFKFKYLVFENDSYIYSPLKEFIMAGYPFGGEIYSSLSITDGKIASTNYIGQRKAVFANMFGKPGNSGSPILDKANKRIIGLFWGGIKHEDEMIKCFTPIDVILNFIR